MHAALAINAVFSARGRAASYVPPGGGTPVPCVIIEDRADRQASGVLGRAVIAGHVITVRRSQIAEPRKNGMFVIDGSAFVVRSDPESEDSARLLWSCTVVPGPVGP